MRYRVVIIMGACVAALAAPSFAQSQVERGMKVFADQKCSMCHSVAGKGNPKGPLEEAASKLSADEIREWLVHPDEMRQKTEPSASRP